MEKECYTIHVDILVPKDEAPTVDDAIDAVGEKLKPWYWVGNIKERLNVMEP